MASDKKNGACAGRLLVVSHTENTDEIGIISARPATAHEIKKYES